MSEDSEQELGIREARRLLTTLVAGVEQDGKPVRLTKHGHHVASIVSAQDADRLALGAKNPLEVPGDIATATRIIEGLLPGGSGLLPEYRSVQAMDTRKITGGLATLLRALFTVIRMKYPYGRVSLHEDENEESESGLSMSVADMLMHKVLDQAVGAALMADEAGDEITGFDKSAFDESAIAIVAGALWAAQIGANPVEWRNKLSQPVTERELVAWVSATYEAADFVRFLIDGSADDESTDDAAPTEGLFWVLEAMYEPESLVEEIEAKERDD
ncbi:type II toxin-antitoxin system prevent-host-death family antitoxin [Streptomyces sp. NPDC096132]|uniref:type II toxin-antitoxin system prevent-host-death family antitoxin n=1 Tax=Streptomyces sp. NPDC096132 TaxID=3366075 RepID=UPI00381CDE48